MNIVNKKLTFEERQKLAQAPHSCFENAKNKKLFCGCRACKICSGCVPDPSCPYIKKLEEED